MLERQIAARATSSSVDIAEAICGLHDADPTNLVDRLSHFLTLMTGISEFGLYLLRDNALKLATGVQDEQQGSGPTLISAVDPLYGAVVGSRKILVATRPADRALLDHHGIAIGPLLSQDSQRVIGMLRIGSDLVDFPEDIERKCTLACAEISRSLGRPALLTALEVAPVAAGLKTDHSDQSHAAGAVHT